eukprot:38814-Chlamydomonas_euryale.AAC.3
MAGPLCGRAHLSDGWSSVRQGALFGWPVLCAAGRTFRMARHAPLCDLTTGRSARPSGLALWARLRKLDSARFGFGCSFFLAASGACALPDYELMLLPSTLAHQQRPVKEFSNYCQPGQYEFPFTVALPKHLPGTFKLEETNNIYAGVTFVYTKAKVQYEIKAECEVQGRSNLKAKVRGDAVGWGRRLRRPREEGKMGRGTGAATQG